MQYDNGAPAPRIDKWLWAARFYKTRALAREAVVGGKIQINGKRARPAITLSIGDELRIRREPYEFIIVVKQLSSRRRQASVAASLYEETEASQQARRELAQRLSANRTYQTHGPEHRPDKRGRRDIMRFTRRDH